MKFIRVSITRKIDPGNPVLLSYLKNQSSLHLLYLKNFARPPELYVAKHNENLFRSIGVETGKEIYFEASGPKLSVRGDHRLINFPENNIGDRLFEILNNEDTGFIEIEIKRHYFENKHNRKNPNSKDNRKLEVREGWKVEIRLINPSLKSYISHLFSSPGIKIDFRRWLVTPPTIAWWEVSYFLPGKCVMKNERGLKIGNTAKSGALFIDPEKDYHTLVVGSTGSGKSTLTYNTIKEIISSKLGKVILIDPHGDTAHKLKSTGAKYFEISPEASTGINILFNYGSKEIKFKIAEDFVSIIKSTREMQFSESFVGPRIEDLISRGIIALSEIEGATIVDLYNIIKNQDARDKIMKSYENENVRRYIEEIGEIPREEMAGTERALGRLALDPFIKSLICNPNDRGTLINKMEESDLILINLERSVFGYEDSRILSNIFAVYLWFTISSIGKGNYYMFLEEAQDYQSKLISDMISAGRKFGLRIFFITTSFKAISSNLESLFFSNISNYVVMKLSDPDKIKIQEFMGIPIEFQEEPLKFTLIASGIQTKGFTERTIFEHYRAAFIETKYQYISTSNQEIEIYNRLSDILNSFESRSDIYFIYEIFALYFKEYEKSRVIGILKKIIKDNSKVQYMGRMNINFKGINGRFEVFKYGSEGGGGKLIPEIFELFSRYIESMLNAK